MSNDIHSIARRLSLRDLGQETVRGVRDVIEQRRVSDLVPIILELEKSITPKPEEAIYSAMNIFQALAYFARPQACLLMSHLYDKADDLFMHDVCDSIDIWIFQYHQNHDNDLKELIQTNPPSDMDEAMRHHYEEWVRG